jgi:hypothetical protein
MIFTINNDSYNIGDTYEASGKSYDKDVYHYVTNYNYDNRNNYDNDETHDNIDSYNN